MSNRVFRILALLLMFAVLAGCASLPPGVERPVSQAATDVADTRLAAVAAASVDAEPPHLSGLRLLPAGDQAFEARIALARAAEKSIDAQYYQIADDATGRQFLRELRNAADRGVRVRVLVDDLQAAGQDALLAGFAAHPGIEVRMFNPLAVREGSVGARVFFSMNEFSRINRRMHNKLFVADSVLAISGGRNIADEYFGRSEPANFIDMDMLSAGPVVAEMTAVFDAYWNSPHAYPIEHLATGISTEAARWHFDRITASAAASDAAPARDSLGQTSIGPQIAAGRIQLQMAAVRVVADSPRKADPGHESLADGVVMNGNLDLMQSAHSEVLIASPYFVPGRRTMEVLQQAADNQVHVSIMTNSLATTDEPLAHFGYARYRQALLERRVALYELMPGDDEHEAHADGPHASLGRLHAKLAVVDRRWLSIGSMNMDRRSANANTEMSLIVDSPALASQVAGLLRNDRLPRSYQVRSTPGRQGIEWVSQRGKEEVVLSQEPNATAARRLRLQMLAAMVDEELL
ncbi:Phosphatidylserine/phosphatidylglycerophosphate/cardiolipin synthase [Variovorax sp. HW608]|uniref:phospholipase D-like domain-containing protein n=1 Tax=Variovorax sp. HW608 TaxID=1034889 RepID=UPI00081F9901|nr:phospholipase D family protein [Variovorax sp. HW608]SCK57414.1 Phosphatidylserine/phosphatidylglycerophosphate/cardiolipin synthase [Variovorax sp. HW608]